MTGYQSSLTTGNLQRESSREMKSERLWEELQKGAVKQNEVSLPLVRAPPMDLILCHLNSAPGLLHYLQG